jgi:hypothetical protein
MYIATTRFNEKTKTENTNFKIRHGIQKDSVIYNVPLPIHPKLNKGIFIFVIEMNNEKNAICGISVIKNFIWYDKIYEIYSDYNLNRYTYKGYNYIERDHLYSINPKLIGIIELLCFKGKSHLKRMNGISIIRNKLLNDKRCEGLDIVRELQNLMNYCISSSNDVSVSVSVKE